MLSHTEASPPILKKYVNLKMMPHIVHMWSGCREDKIKTLCILKMNLKSNLNIM